MIPGQFEYVRPAGLHDALRILSEREGEAKVLSGGYSLLPLLKLRLAQPGLLVDIRDVDGLDGIVETDDDLRIGGRATHRQILEDPTVRAGYPLLVDAAGGIGDPQVRNWGTIGGSCAHADPSSDWPAVLLATSASVVCRSSHGERASPPATSSSIRSRRPSSRPSSSPRSASRAGRGSGGAYAKLERRVGDFSTVGCAAIVTIGADGRIADAGIGLTAVADTPFASTDAEAASSAAQPSDATFRAAGAAAAAEPARPTTATARPTTSGRWSRR